MSEEKILLSKEEFDVLKKRVLSLAETEAKHPGLVLGRCNGKIDSTRRFLARELKNKDSTRRCIQVLQDYGGYCNCEILYNVLPELERIEKDVVRKTE